MKLSERKSHLRRCRFTDKAKRDLGIISRILLYCTEIDQTVARFGNSYENFNSDKIYRNAATMCILQIGELAGRLSSDFTAANPSVPWRSIKAMRNIAAHAYGSMSIPDIWDTITSDIPALKEFCQELLKI